MHIQNALGISPSVAQSIIDTYYKVPSCRFNRSPRDAIDKKFLERATRIMGAHKTYSLVDSDMVQIKRMERDAVREAMLKNEVSRLRDEMTGTKPKQGVTEMSDMDRLEQKMQEQHDNLLAALQSLRGGGGQFYGQGSRNQEVVIQPPPRQSMQAQHSTAHTGAKEVSTDPGDSAAAAIAFPQLVFWR